MPEIAEVARIAHFLNTYVVGKKIAKAIAVDDQIVYGKAGTSSSTFEKALAGREVVSAGSQGKYFWMTLDKPPHPVMHFGMTGWIHIKGRQTAYSKYLKKLKPEFAELWPPRFWKFHLETEGEDKIQVAFTDPRRLARIRLVDCPGDKIRSYSPLVENGPDPVIDHPETFNEDFFIGKLQSKRVPIKSLLLDQAVVSGIGNWVGDEVLYHARIHPEHYSNELSESQMKALYRAVRDVCQRAVDVLGESEEFPDDWLFHYRWGKGKATEGVLPNGTKLAFVTVGGRTSCYAPSLQKKGSVKALDIEPPKPKTKRKRVEEDPELVVAKAKMSATGQKTMRTKKENRIEDVAEVDAKPQMPPQGDQSKTSTVTKTNKAVRNKEKPIKNNEAIKVESTMRRRSARLSKVDISTSPYF